MFETFNDLFKPENEKVVEKKVKDAEVALQIAGDLARRCLAMEEFRLYRDSFIRADKALIDALIAYNHYFSISETGDISKYAMKVNRLLTKAETLRKLLTDIESNAKRALNKKEEKSEE